MSVPCDCAASVRSQRASLLICVFKKPLNQLHNKDHAASALSSSSANLFVHLDICSHAGDELLFCCFCPSLLHPQCPLDAPERKREREKAKNQKKKQLNNNTINHLLCMARASVFYIMRTAFFFPRRPGL